MKSEPVPNVTQDRVVNEVIKRLHEMGNPIRAQGTEQYFKNEIVALGIATPALRLLMRETMKPLRLQWELRQGMQLCHRLLQEPELETRAAGIIALSALKRKFTPEVLPQADLWLASRLDNWALVDTFCGSILSPLLEQFCEVERALIGWSGKKCLWQRRAALVTLVPFARRGHRLDLAYKLSKDHFGDPEDLMHKATGWLLREAGKTDRARLKKFLLQHGPKIPRTALRYAIEHFPSTERAELLLATRIA